MANVQPTSNVPNDLLAAAVRDLKKHKNLVIVAQVGYKNTVKSWEDKGVNRNALKRMMKFIDTPEETFLSEEAQFLRMMAVNGHAKVSTLLEGLDLSPLGPEAMREHAVWQAYDIGYQCGMAGEERAINPWKAGTETHVSWDDGWREGAKTLKATLPEKTEMASARRERKVSEPAPAPAAAPEPAWDAKAKAEAEQAAAEMDQANAEAEDDGDEEGGDDDVMELPGGGQVRAASAEPVPRPKSKGGRPPGSKNRLPRGKPRGAGRPRKPQAA